VVERKDKIIDYYFRYYDSAGILENLDRLVVTLSNIAISAQGEEPSEEMCVRVRGKLKHCENLVVVESQGIAVGFGIFVLIPTANDGIILYEDGKMVSQGFQGQGIGADITKQAKEKLSHHCFVMRTQNPAEMTSVTKEFPNLKPYDRNDPIHRRLLLAIAERLSETEETDFERGVFRPEKRRGRIGDYQIRLSDPRVQEVEDIFSKRELDREYGERLYFIAVPGGQEETENQKRLK